MLKKNRRPLKVVCGPSPRTTTAAAAAVAAAAAKTTTTTTTTTTSKKRRHSAPEGKSQRQRTEPPSPAPPCPVPPSPAPSIPATPSTPSDLLPPPLPHQPFAFPQPHHHHHHHHPPPQASNPLPTLSITPSPTQSPTTLVPVSTALLHSTSATSSTSASTSSSSPTHATPTHVTPSHVTPTSSAPGARRSVRGLVQGALDWYAGKMSLRAKSGKFKGIANDANNHHDVVKYGYLRKLKTNRRKFFVLRSDAGPEAPARIEYYESESKFITGAQPKKQIILKDCCNINRKADPKQCVITIFTERDNLDIVAESEEELGDWLHNLLRHQKASQDSNHIKPSYEHVWQVVVHPKGLGSTRPITGQRRICLTCRSLSLVESSQSKIEFPLNMIRRCGYSGIFFYIEVGRLAMTGPGHLWMETEDAIIAQNMYSVIRTAMQDHGGSFDEDVATQRLQQQHSADQDCQGATRHRTTSFSTQPRPCTEGYPGSSRRDRSGSMPSRSRTSSEGSSLTTKPCQGVGSTPNHHHHHPHHHHPVNPSAHNRPHSMYSPPLSASCSPPCVLPLHSPNSYSSESMESSVSAEDLDNSQRCDSLAGLDEDHLSYMEVAPSPSLTPLPAGPSQPPQSLPLSSHPSHKPILPGMLSPAGMDKCSSPPDMGSYMMMNSPTELLPAGAVSSTPGYLVMLPGNPPITTSASSSMGSAGSGAGNESSYLQMESPGVMPSSSSSWSPINRALLSSSSHIKSPPSAPTSASHSRSSSQVEDMTEGYLLMNPSAPSSASDTPTGLPRERSDGYVDMTPTAALPCPIPGATLDGDEMSPGSSSSFTSGTPSDHRLQDFGEKGVSGFYGSEDDESASSMDRPVRANSVGSKPEQFRSRKNSAPILGSSPISNSWSGTPGVFFKGFLQARSQERYEDLMEIDFSKNKSCDSISNVKDKKKSSSIESLKRTITGHRHRSNSKSSGSGKTSVFDSLKREKKKSESEPKGIDPPFGLTEDKHCEMEFSRSPRRNTSEHIEGYLKMNPSTGSISSSISDYMEMEPDMDHVDGKGPGSKDRHPSEGYVEMGQLCYSSGTTSSSTSSSSASRVRKISHCFNPLSSHHDISSPLQEYMTVDLSLDASSQSLEGDKGRKKDKKNSRKKSKDSTKRKKSDPIAVQSRSREGGGSDLPSWESFKNKSTSPLSSISNFLTRKNSSGTPPKTPLSPTGSPLPKSNRGTPSPFSSLTRSKSREGGSSGGKGPVAGDKEALGSGAMVVGVEEAIKEGEESPTSSYTVMAAGSSGVGGSAVLLGGGPSVLRGGSGSDTTLTVPKCDSSLLHASVVGGVGGASRRSSGVLLEAEEEDKTSQEEETVGAGSYVNLVPGVGGPALVSSGGAVCSGAMAAVPEEGQQGRQTSALAVPPDTLRMPSLLPTVCDVPSSSHDYVNLCPGRKLPHRSPSLSRDKQAVSGDVGAVSACGSGGGWSAAGRSKVPTRDDHDYMLLMPGGKTEGVSEASKSSQEPEVPCKGTSEVSLKGLGEASNEPCEATKGPSEASKGTSEASKVKGLVKKPEIPKLLLLNRSEQRHAPADLASALQRVNLGSGVAGGGGSSVPVSSERSRSHSGPGAPESSAMSGESRMVGGSKRGGEARHASGGDTVGGKAASACSSPVSYSPPTSPTLRGSMSSVSSLSESGMSSASSTCTVVNVGLAAARRDPGQSPHPQQDQQQPPSPCPILSTVPPVGATNQQPPGPVAAASAATVSASASVVTSTPAAEVTTTTTTVAAVAPTAPTPARDNLNYASLDLAPAKCEGVMPSPRAARRTTSSSSSGGGGGPSAMMEEELQEEGGEALSYAQIDFTKSEGLSITRRHASRH